MVLNLGANSGFFWGAIGVILFHFVSYYTLLDSVSKNIEKKRKESLDKLTIKFKKATKEKFIEIHQEIHQHQNIFRGLNEKKLQTFYSSIGLFILSLMGWGLGFFPSLLESIVMVIMFMFMLGFIMLINLSILLRWNLKNP